jgi:uncharacterized cupin superfamily protein
MGTEVGEFFPTADGMEHLLENLSAYFGRKIEVGDITKVEIKDYNPRRDEWRVVVHVKEEEREDEQSS